MDGDREEFLRIFDSARARPLLALAVFIAFVAASAVVAAATPPRYESDATLLTFEERDAMLSLMKTNAFRADVASALAANGSAPAGLDAASLDGHVRVALGFVRTLNEDQSIIEVTAHWTDAGTAQAIAQGYLDALARHRGDLENASHDRLWASELAKAGGNATIAERNVSAIVAGYRYAEVLDRPTLPARPVAPLWSLDLGLGALTGGIAAILVPLAFRGRNA